MSDFGPAIDPSQLPGVTDQEVQQLSDVIRVVTSDCAPPSIQFAIPKEGLQELFRYVCGFLREFDVPRWIATIIAGLAVLPLLVVNALFSTLLAVLAPFLSSLFKEVLGLLETLRRELDPSFAAAAVLVLNELLGTEFTVDHLAQGIDVTSHLARADEVGGLLHDQLTREFQSPGDLTPAAGAAAARRMSGFLINFGTATGIIAALGGLVPFVHLDEMREIGEEVARNLGLGRMHREVMRPLIRTLIGTPYQWYLNLRFHPTQFKEGDLINPFQQTLMSHDQIFQALDLLGFSDDKKEELIKLHQKRLTLDDLDLLQRYGTSSAQFVVDYVKTLGWPEELQDVVRSLVDLRRADAAVRELIAAMETYAADGHITLDDLSTLLDNLPIGPMEKRFLLARVQFKVKAPHKTLTIAEIQSAFEQGALTLDDLDTRFTAMGYSLEDVGILEILTLLKLAKLDESKKVAQFAYDKKVAAAKAKNRPIPPAPAILSS